MAPIVDVIMTPAQEQESGIEARPGAAAADDRWLDWGGTGALLHLAHGNGFPPASYRRLVEALRDNGRHVVSMAARPLWGDRRPEDVGGWDALADDLRHELRRRGFSGGVGVGHSLGAVTTLLAAVRDPELFSGIVLIDPVLLAGWRSAVWALMKGAGLRRLLPIARRARRRRDCWPDRRTVEGAWRALPVFAGWDRAVLEDYLAAGLVELPGGGVGLRYPKAWEARIFETAPHDPWPEVGQVKVPALFIQGELSDAYVVGALRRTRRELPDSRIEVIGGASHFVPMERPDEVARLILDFITADNV